MHGPEEYFAGQAPLLALLHHRRNEPADAHDGKHTSTGCVISFVPYSYVCGRHIGSGGDDVFGFELDGFEYYVARDERRLMLLDGSRFLFASVDFTALILAPKKESVFERKMRLM